MKAILNIAGGKIKPFEFESSKIKLYDDFSLLVNLDKMYYDPSNISEIITMHNDNTEYNEIIEYNSDLDVYEFLERYHIPFDGIAIYRFLEHVPKVQVLYFIYLFHQLVDL